MRKILVAFAILTIISTVIAAGCGGRDRDHLVDLNDILMEGENYNYEGEQGDLIVFAEDGTFRSVIGDVVEDGTYKIFQTEEGSWVELVFINEKGDEDRVEEWQMTAAIGEGDTVTDLNGQQFILQGTRQTLR